MGQEGGHFGELMGAVISIIVVVNDVVFLKGGQRGMAMAMAMVAKGYFCQRRENFVFMWWLRHFLWWLPSIHLRRLWRRCRWSFHVEVFGSVRSK